MAEEIIKIEDFNFKANQVASRELDRKFGRPEDYAELHILSITDQVINSDFNFINYTTSPESIDQEGLISEINMDPVSELNNFGYSSGKYKIKLFLLRRKILNSPISIFSIKEISSARRELRLKLNSAFNNTETIASIRNFINEVESNIFFKDFGLNFMQGEVITAINIALDERGKQPELLIKLLNPLSTSYNIDNECNIVEEVIDPTVLTINLGRPEDIDDSIPLRGPNFKIDTRLNSSIPSTFKTYDDILNSSTVLSSSYNELLSNLEEDDVLNIDYDYIRTVSGSNVGDPLEEVYHFENFVHFGSAVERLKNFEYKLSLVELYDKDLSSLNSITGPTSASSFTITAKSDIITKKDKLIHGFDGYEKFLYFTSGSKFTWPKQNTSKPFILYSITSSQAKNWLGDERSAFPTYGGQLLSASLFDRQNQNNLERLIPNHVLDNSDNEQYRLFANMIGQHFDNVWTHIKHITEIPDTHHTRGISRDLVYFTLKSLGVEAFDQFENSNLIEYILGQGTTGSAFYDVPTQQTLVTASNEGSLPKQDLSKEVWKRLYHNAPHLLKTKGTERGIRALMSCYGIPSTILNVKEYGGPVKDRTGYKTFSYEKSGLALKTTDTIGTVDYMVRFPWKTNNIGGKTSKSIELRIKPIKGNEGVALSLGDAPNDASGLQLKLEKYTGNDISSSNDASTYGRINLTQGAAFTVRASTSYFPLYNGNFWNIHLMGTGTDVNFGAYQTNHLKNTSKFTGTWDSNNYAATFGANSGAGRTYVYGGTIGYKGSIQELKSNWGEELTDSTLTKHALEPFMYAGNTISSSFNNIVIRLPLGSTDAETLENHPPDTSLINANTVAGTTVSTSWEEVVETHHHPTPDTVGISMTSEKVRTDEGTIDDDILSIRTKSEVSTLDRQPQDFEDLGVFFSPTTEINEDIVYQLGAFRLDDYIG